MQRVAIGNDIGMFRAKVATFKLLGKGLDALDDYFDTGRSGRIAQP